MPVPICHRCKQRAESFKNKNRINLRIHRCLPSFELNKTFSQKSISFLFLSAFLNHIPMLENIWVCRVWVDSAKSIRLCTWTKWFCCINQTFFNSIHRNAIPTLITRSSGLTCNTIKNSKRIFLIFERKYNPKNIIPNTFIVWYNTSNYILRIHEYGWNYRTHRAHLRMRMRMWNVW